MSAGAVRTARAHSTPEDRADIIDGLARAHRSHSPTVTIRGLARRTGLSEHRVESAVDHMLMLGTVTEDRFTSTSVRNVSLTAAGWEAAGGKPLWMR